MLFDFSRIFHPIIPLLFSLHSLLSFCHQLFLRGYRIIQASLWRALSLLIFATFLGFSSFVDQLCIPLKFYFWPTLDTPPIFLPSIPIFLCYHKIVHFSFWFLQAFGLSLPPLIIVLLLIFELLQIFPFPIFTFRWQFSFLLQFISFFVHPAQFVFAWLWLFTISKFIDISFTVIIFIWSFQSAYSAIYPIYFLFFLTQNTLFSALAILGPTSAILVAFLSSTLLTNRRAFLNFGFFFTHIQTNGSLTFLLPGALFPRHFLPSNFWWYLNSLR